MSHTTGRQGAYVVGGTIPFSADCYIQRCADRDLLKALIQGEFCYVLTARQMGKSSLMVRTAGVLRENGIAVVTLDLTAVGQNLTPEQWYDGLLVRMARQLHLEDELEQFWFNHLQLSPVQRFFSAIREVCLEQRHNTLVIFVDELDLVRSVPFNTDEFFAAIREFYNRRTEDAACQRLTFCLLGVSTPSELVQGNQRTPFNIGRRIELRDFTLTEAKPLAAGLRAGPDSQRLLARIFRWTNGHPYLAQRLCHAVANLNSDGENEHAHLRHDRDVDRLCNQIFLSAEARERDDNLLFVRDRILRSEIGSKEALRIYMEIYRGHRVRDDEEDDFKNLLMHAGIVRRHDGRLKERNRIYSRVFDSDWILDHLPRSDRLGQDQSFWKGFLKASFAIVILFATLLLLFDNRMSNNQEKALAFAAHTHSVAVNEYLSRAKLDTLLIASFEPFLDSSPPSQLESVTRHLNAAAIHRLDDRNRITFSHGLAIPEQFWPASTAQPGDPVASGPMDIEGRKVIIVRTPALDSRGKPVGAYLVAFGLAELEALLTEFRFNHDPEQLRLAMPTQGSPQVFYESSSPGTPTNNNEAKLSQDALRRAIHGEQGLDKTYDCMAAFKPVGSMGWGMVLVVHRSFRWITTLGGSLIAVSLLISMAVYAYKTKHLRMATEPIQNQEPVHSQKDK